GDGGAGALTSAGRAVLFAGTTVCIAVLGMLVLRVGYVSGLCIAARSWCCSRWPPRSPCCPRCWASSGCGYCPAGNAGGWPLTGPSATARPPGGPRLAGFIQRHPLKLAAAATAAMVVLAIPVLSLRLRASHAGHRPAAAHTPPAA